MITAKFYQTVQEELRESEQWLPQSRRQPTLVAPSCCHTTPLGDGTSCSLTGAHCTGMASNSGGQCTCLPFGQRRSLLLPIFLCCQEMAIWRVCCKVGLQAELGARAHVVVPPQVHAMASWRVAYCLQQTTCSMCLQDFVNPMIPDCGHNICCSCLTHC